MTEHFLMFPASETIPMGSTEKVSWPGYADYYLNPGTIRTSKMCSYTPVPGKSICTRFRLVMRGMFSTFYSPDAYIKANLLKNGKIIPDGEILFQTLREPYVVTRHKTTFPDVQFDDGDTIAIQIEYRYIKGTDIDQYLSAVLNFEDYYRTPYFVQFAASKAITYSGYTDYYLNPGNIPVSRMCAYTPIPRKSKLTRWRLVTRGRWIGPFDASYIDAFICKNGKKLNEGQINMVSGTDTGVLTRHHTRYPDIEFEEGDTVGIFITTYRIEESGYTQYLSAILNFE